MAQVFVPENPREREQLQGGVGVSDREQRPQRKPYSSRRFGTIDLVLILVIVAAISLLVLAAARWASPLTPAVTINLSPSALPAYAWYSLLGMIPGYLLALIFTLIYGQIAATRRRAEVLAHSALLRQIVRELEKAPGHTLPEEYFLSLMEEHFEEDEAQEQLDTAINWGRYAELFTFQDDRGVFRLEEPELAETV